MTGSETLLLIIFAIVAFLIGLSKGGLGGTAGALATPMLALVMPADKVIGLILGMNFFSYQSRPRLFNKTNRVIMPATNGMPR